MNNTYRPNVIVVNSIFAAMLRRNHDLVTVEKDMLLGNEESKENVIDVLKTIGTPTIKTWFTTRLDTVDGNVIALTMNPDRDSWKNGEGRKSDARRIARAVATLEVSVAYRAAKKLKAGEYITLDREGDVVRSPFNENGKAYLKYTVEQNVLDLVPTKWAIDEKGKYPKSLSVSTPDATALRIPLGARQLIADKVGLAWALENGYSIVLSGDFQHLFIQTYKMFKFQLEGDFEAFHNLRKEIADRQAAYAIKQALANGATILE